MTIRSGIFCSFTYFYGAVLPAAGGLIFLRLNRELNIESFRDISRGDRTKFLFMSAFSVIYMMILPNVIMMIDISDGAQRMFLAANSAAGLSLGVFGYVYIFLMYRKLQALFGIEREKALTERRLELAALKSRQSAEHRWEADRLTADILDILDRASERIGQNDAAAAIELLGGGAVRMQTLKRPAGTGSRVADYFIYKTQDASDRLSIDFSYECAPVPAGRIDVFDACTILSNILDNAVNACKDLQAARFIHLKIHLNQNVLFISCENSKDRAQAVRPREGLHGYGLANVRDCAARYGGDLRIEDAGDVFRVQILLYV